MGEVKHWCRHPVTKRAGHEPSWASFASTEATDTYRVPVCCCSRYCVLQPIRLPQWAYQICRKTISSAQPRAVTPTSAFPHNRVHTRCSHFVSIHVAVDTIRPYRPTAPVCRGSRVVWYGNANFSPIAVAEWGKNSQTTEVHTVQKASSQGDTDPPSTAAGIYISSSARPASIYAFWSLFVFDTSGRQTQCGSAQTSTFY
ncbi:Piso0_005484 [Millerozyma farinosa CBS 7064]|uniref:Piso0_005484 protein n=1 Tax=Pichia sorbitophila (strain ATCC MYA-4447 / BCRC 22081 / CBS 7064 / NBRC 10061 / NRRL Y-12695) TaxID=559304 RepID=G8Y580_PICSO|nr:Piso0_005484 [Millerozyma farinosa CBS 7064]